jgi:hypothetical protein
MYGMKGSAGALLRPASAEVVIDLRDQPSPATGRDRRRAMGASRLIGRTRDCDRPRLVVDRILGAWFGVMVFSVDGGPGAISVSGRVCGGDSPTMSSDRPSPGRGS